MRARDYRIAAALAALTAAGTAWAGPDWEEGAFGSGDAGNLPSNRQVPFGKPAGSDLNSISGDLGGFLTGPVDMQDMYLIEIDDPGTFSVIVNPPVNLAGPALDAQLWLFTETGFGLLANDGTGTSASFATAANDGSGSSVTAPGRYLLAISPAGSDPIDAAGGPLFDQAVAGEISGPDGLGGANPIADWTTGATTSGSYVIYVSGGAFPGCAGDVTDDGFVDVSDLVAVILAWGPCAGCPEDLDGNGFVDVADLVDVILHWGICAPS